MLTIKLLELPTIQALRECAKEHGFDDLEAWGRWCCKGLCLT